MLNSTHVLLYVCPGGKAECIALCSVSRFDNSFPSDFHIMYKAKRSMIRNAKHFKVGVPQKAATSYAVGCDLLGDRSQGLRILVQVILESATVGL